VRCHISCSVGSATPFRFHSSRGPSAKAAFKVSFIAPAPRRQCSLVPVPTNLAPPRCCSPRTDDAMRCAATNSTSASRKSWREVATPEPPLLLFGVENKRPPSLKPRTTRTSPSSDTTCSWSLAVKTRAPSIISRPPSFVRLSLTA